MKFAAVFAGLVMAMMIAAPVLVHADKQCVDKDFGTITVPDNIPCPPAATTGDQSTIYKILEKVIQILFYVLMFLAVIMILVAAFNFVTAQGNPEKVEKAQAAIMYAVIAIVIGVLARSVPIIVSTFVQTNVL